MFLARLGFLSLLSLVQLALGAVQFQSPDDLPGIEYDFIVVGGGNAGAVVASRLGENQDYKILVIEAGLSDAEVPDSRVPGLSHNFAVTGNRADWNYTTTPQVHVNGKVTPYLRGLMLGGCSSHNEMMYTRGSRDDYDRWAAVTGDNNLSWSKMFPYILKAETWSGPNDPNLPEDGHYDPSVHGRSGNVNVSAAYYAHPLNDLWVAATKELSKSSDEFPPLLDMNGGRMIGMGRTSVTTSWDQDTIGHGVRSSSVTAYLAHTSDNVHVLLNTRVTRVVPSTDNHPNGTDIRSVEFATTSEGPRYNLTATKELIISGGVINSPQILLNSGIGPREELEALGITLLIDNPSVGKNFSDQPAVPIGFSTNLPIDEFNKTAALVEWNTSHTGRLAVPPHMAPLGWVRFPPTAAPFKDGSSDPTGGQNSPHVELFFRNVTLIPAWQTPKGNASILMLIVDGNPMSRGSITLATSSPFDAPLIDPNFLAAPIDTAILLEGVRSAQRLFSAQTFSSSVFGLVGPAPDANGTLTDESITDYIKHVTQPNIHGVASCSMAPHGADWGVVDPEFKVRGTAGLRIVDASVLPFVPSGHTQAPTYAIAEWASDVIKSSWTKN
ncbi:GMC oxidoreductase [Macrolepiota fuliginosa MF-IS2]|uniref:pyranose dehydrogenase (acceptor) n=1 Tax=Macrolepiota fuliginosa MF-IS2 TaxID=1400762 RepID=A0A9P5WX82_9AGAR|nr:GMC oxidoreductase [Macrolepiota fuliginosa MF-IS2]